MNKQQIALKLVLDELKLTVSVKSFEERLVLQKGSYLAQAAGVNLGYYFSWYLHGPYCSSLAKDAFAMSDELDARSDELDDWQLDQGTISTLARVLALINGCNVQDPTKRLELLASVHFLVARKGFSASDISTLTHALQGFGKDFGEREVASALEGLAKYGFISD